MKMPHTATLFVLLALMLSACGQSNVRPPQEVIPIQCSAEGWGGCPAPEASGSPLLRTSDGEDIRNYYRFAVCRGRYALLEACVARARQAGYVIPLVRP